MKDIPIERRDLRSEVIDGKIYAFGGTQYGEALSITEMYDPETDEWIPNADMKIGRFYHASGVANVKIYAVGGTIQLNPMKDVENYTR